MVLIDFTMENFKSFKTETTLSAEVGERLSKYKRTNTLDIGRTAVLKSLLIFGANGAGKSNLLAGIKTMQQMVLNNPAKATDALPATPFLLDADSGNAETRFAVDFKQGNAEYRYEFSYDQKTIQHEALIKVHGNRETVYFERVGQKFLTLPSALTEVAERTKANTLFLFMAQQNNDAAAIAVMTWFAEDLVFVADFDEAEIPEELAVLVRNKRVKQQLLRFLHFADFNIVDSDLLEGDRPQLLMGHKVYDTDGQYTGKDKKMTLTSESRGTRQLLLMALSMINAKLTGDGKTLLVDGFGDSLHLALSQALVKIFNFAANQNQVILTTHDLPLLDSALRVDQIYLVEKGFQGISELRSIFDFRDSRNTSRQGISYMKRYIEGRFGATPIIDADGMLTSLMDL
ncbi:AAA family ATPase [Levilactobacillus suantsaiihabitans]|uniref:AAA family ATPase n=1 Tax=Levilactobacillus suantsaiihabitans TaxID=2487722 RepID=UPI00384CC809